MSEQEYARFGDMKMFMHHIYEFKKGVRSLVLCTMCRTCASIVAERLRGQQIGYMMVVYIAGLQSLPTDVLEAAQVDGASPSQTMFKVIIPLMMPSITVCTFLTVTNGFKLYDQNLALTAGNPAHQSEMLALNIFNTFYGRVGFEGVGQAKAVIFFIIVAVIALIQNRLTTSKEVLV